jgi:hypothetical protein
MERNLQKAVGPKQLHLYPGGFKTNDGLIICHEEVHLFKGSVLGSIIQDLQMDIPNA